jgi:hypothetical protein
MMVSEVADINKNEKMIMFPNGGHIEFWSIDSGNPGRSRKYALVVIDEAAHCDLRDVWNNSIRATLADYIGRALFLSSPNGRNFFYDLFHRGQDPDRTDWASWQAPTSQNPYIDPAEIQAAKDDMPELTFRQEMLGEFVNFEGSVFRLLERSLFEPAPEMQRRESPRFWTPAQSYLPAVALGIDWGRTVDPTVITVACDMAFTPTGADESGSSNGLVRRRCSVLEIDRFKGMPFPLQRARVRAIWERYGRPPIVAESNSIGTPQLEELNREGIPVIGFHTSATSKQAIIDSLVLAFEQGAIRIPRNPVLIGELSQFQATRLPSGGIKYAAPNGQHDDTVISLALSYYGLLNHTLSSDPALAYARREHGLKILGGAYMGW